MFVGYCALPRYSKSPSESGPLKISFVYTKRFSILKGSADSLHDPRTELPSQWCSLIRKCEFLFAKNPVHFPFCMRDNIARIKPSSNSIDQLPYGEKAERCRQTITYKAFFPSSKHSENDPTRRNSKKTGSKKELSETGFGLTIDLYLKGLVAHGAGDICYGVSFLRNSKRFLPCLMLAQCHCTPHRASVNLFLKHTSEPYGNRIRRHFLPWLGLILLRGLIPSHRATTLDASFDGPNSQTAGLMMSARAALGNTY